MKYRKFGNTGIEISALGFGCMRLPFSVKDGKTIYDYDESGRMIRRAIELGVNYFDTAPGYCDEESEIIVGQALKGLRDKVYVSTKYRVESASGDDYRRSLEMSLKKLDMDHIDFYHMWGMSLDTYENKVMAKDGPFAAAQKAKEEGLIRHISFSCHDNAENMIKIAETGNFDSMLCQYNLLDGSNEKAIARARKLGLGTVVMGPVGGGRLGGSSEVISSLIPGGAKSNPELALRFVLTNPDVCCALSGMSAMAHVEENCRTANQDDFLTEAEIAAVNEAIEENKKLTELYCTGCRYCMPCPQGVNIPTAFQMMNYHKVYKLTDYAKQMYAGIGKIPYLPGNDASACVECGECEEKCPQNIKIIEQLKETHAALA